jgi:hypothetical protein
MLFFKRYNGADVKVPKRVRELWIGVAAFVKCNQVNSKELRFALPVNNKGNELYSKT